MYEDHFFLNRRPFNIFPEPDMLVWSEVHRMAHAMLVYGITSTHGIVAITGDIGSGKTTLLNAILNDYEHQFHFGQLTGRWGYDGNIAAWVLYGLAQTVEGESLSDAAATKLLKTYLMDKAAQGRKVILMIDEAQAIDHKVLEELRLVVDTLVNSQPVLQLVLLGQPELARSVSSQNMKQFRQRIVSHYHLGPMAVSYTHLTLPTKA